MQAAFIAAAVVIVLVLWYILQSGNDKIESFVSGCWIAPDDFCQSADIGSMMIVIDDLVTEGWTGFGRTRKREGYLVILPNGISTPMHIEYYSVSNPDPYTANIKAYVKFDDGPDWGCEQVPCGEGETVTMAVNMILGSMEITGEKNGQTTVYARLYRQNDISEMSKGITQSTDVD